jgi:hypothetical protein
MYDVKKGAGGLCAPLEIRIAITVRDGAESLKGSHRTGGRRIFLKTSGPFSLMNTL